MVPSRELTYPPKMGIEDDFPFPKVGYVNSLEGRYFLGVFSGLLRLKLRGNSPLRYATSVLKSLRGGAVLQDFPQVTPGGKGGERSTWNGVYNPQENARNSEEDLRSEYIYICLRSLMEILGHVILIELNLVLLTFKDASSLYIIAFLGGIGHHDLTFIRHLWVFFVGPCPPQGLALSAGDQAGLTQQNMP